MSFCGVMTYPDWRFAAIPVCVLSGWSEALLLHDMLLEGCPLWSSPPESRAGRIFHLKTMLFGNVWTTVCRQIIYMMRCFLDFSDDSLAVTLEGARHNHEPSKLQVTLQSIATHLPDLCEPQTSSSVSAQLSSTKSFSPDKSNWNISDTLKALRKH